MWSGRILLLLLPLAVVAQYLLSHRASSAFICPDPFAPLSETPSLASRSRALPIPTLSPAFTLSLSRDLSTCNSFELVFSRTDLAKCAIAERDTQPSLDDDLNAWIKSRLGPDTIAVQVEGAERQLLDVPSEYLGNCSYAYRFTLMNPGKVWVSAELLHEDYEGFKEPREVPISRPAPVLLRQPLLRQPLELDLCPSRCTPYLPRPDLAAPLHISASSFSSPDALHLAQDDPTSHLSSCSASTPLSGGYLPLSPYALNHPGASLPASARSTALRRSSAGLYAFHRPSCAMTHAGVRFANHAPCLAGKHKALFLGDSHARVAYDVIKWRMEGHDEMALASPKELLKNTTVGGLGLYFKWDSYFDEKLGCDYLDQFDSITLSVGSHAACFKCPPTSSWVAHMRIALHALPALLRTCPTQKPRSLLLFTLPTFPPELGNNDCRTGPRMHRWNSELRAIAAERGEWQVVDVEGYSRPVQDDMRMFDGTHYLRTDAVDPIVDEIIARIGFCGEEGAVDGALA
ncbi:hypothetical protein JCM10450v2_007650 [Rhodotorula kratochvilovae]